MIIFAFLSLATINSKAAEIYFSGNRVFSDKELAKLSSQSSSTDSTAASISEYYKEHGYFAVVVHKEEKQGRTIFAITEGSPAIIKKIYIDISPDSLNEFGEMINDLNGQIASSMILDGFAQAVVSRLAERGMPFARASWESFEFSDDDQLAARLKINPGPICHIKGIIFDGISRTRPETIARTARVNLHEIYMESEIIQSERRIDLMPYVEITAPFELRMNSRGDSCTVVYHVRELPSTRFDGAAGYVAVKDRSEFTGRADIDIGDIVGTGRAFGLKWNRKDRYSNELRINYLEPFLLGSAFDMQLEVYQIDRDSLFIESGGSARFGYRAGDRLRTNVIFGLRQVEPETGANLTSSTGRSVGFDIVYDATDYPSNPRRGHILKSGIDYKYRANRVVVEGDNPPSNLTSVSFKEQIFLGLSRSLVFAVGANGWGIVSADGSVPVDELKFIGGFNDLRGYADQRFPAYRYGIVSLEARFLTGRNSRAYLFGDFGAIKSSQNSDVDYKFHPGYGIGIQSPTTLGLFKVEAGWGETGFPSEAVINFGVTGSF